MAGMFNKIMGGGSKAAPVAPQVQLSSAVPAAAPVATPVEAPAAAPVAVPVLVATPVSNDEVAVAPPAAPLADPPAAPPAEPEVAVEEPATKFCKECVDLARGELLEFSVCAEETNPSVADAGGSGMFPEDRIWTMVLSNCDLEALAVIVKSGLRKQLKATVEWRRRNEFWEEPAVKLCFGDLPFAVFLAALKAAVKAEKGQKGAMEYWCTEFLGQLITVTPGGAAGSEARGTDIPTAMAEQAVAALSSPCLNHLFQPVSARTKVWLAKQAVEVLKDVLGAEEAAPSDQELGAAWEIVNARLASQEPPAQRIAACSVLQAEPTVEEDSVEILTQESGMEDAPTGDPADEVVLLAPVQDPELAQDPEPVLDVPPPVVPPPVVPPPVVPPPVVPPPVVPPPVVPPPVVPPPVVSTSSTRDAFSGFLGVLHQLQHAPDSHDVTSSGFLGQAKHAMQLLLGPDVPVVDVSPVQRVIEFAREHATPRAFPLISLDKVTALEVAASQLLQELGSGKVQPKERPVGVIDLLWLEFVSLQLHHPNPHPIIKPAPRPGCDLRQVSQDIDHMMLSTGPVPATFTAQVDAMRGRVGASVVSVLRSRKEASASTVHAAAAAFNACMAELRHLGQVGKTDVAGAPVLLPVAAPLAHPVSSRPTVSVPTVALTAQGGGGGSAGAGTAPTVAVDPASKLGLAMTTLAAANGTASVKALDTVDGFQFLKLIIGNNGALAAARSNPPVWTLPTVLWKCVVYAFSVASNLPPFLPLGVLGRLAMFYVRYLPNAAMERFTAQKPFNEVNMQELVAAIRAADAGGDTNLGDALRQLKMLAEVWQKLPTIKHLWMPSSRHTFVDPRFQAGIVAAAMLAHGPSSDVQRAATLYLKQNASARKFHTDCLTVCGAFMDAMTACAGSGALVADPGLVKDLVTLVCAKAATVPPPKRGATAKASANKRSKHDVQQDDDDDDDDGADLFSS